MAKTANPKSVDLGTAQAQLEATTRALKAAQRAKAKADADHDRAVEAHESARASFNAAVMTISTATKVTDLMAR